MQLKHKQRKLEKDIIVLKQQIAYPKETIDKIISEEIEVEDTYYRDTKR